MSFILNEFHKKNEKLRSLNFMPRVSVVMPAYNDEKYVEEAVQSVLRQTYQDFELVITDNGSIDATYLAIKKFTSDSRVKLLRLPRNQGHCGGMNNSIRNAKGEFISLLNSDDAFLPDKLEKQVQFLDKNPDIGAVFSYAEIFDKDGNPFSGETAYKGIFDRPNQTSRFAWLRNFFLNDNCLCHPSALIRKECQEDIGFFNEKFALLLDFDFWIRLCLKYEFYILPEKLVKFRVHDNQGSAGKPETHSLHYLELTEVLKHYLNPVVIKNFRKIFTRDTLEQMYTGREKTVLDTELEKFLTYFLKGTDTVDSELASFFIAVIAFWIGRPSHRNFCFQILYQLPHSEKLVQNLSDQFSLDFYTFLIKLAKHQDIFGVVNQAKIHGQLHSANQGLENLHSHIHQLENKLDQSQSQVHQAQAELERLLDRSHKPSELTDRSQTNSYYRLTVEKAAYAYYKDDREQMAQYLNQSRKYTSLLPTEIVLNWVKIFNQFFADKGSDLDIESLTNSQEWKKVIDDLVKEHLEASNNA